MKIGNATLFMATDAMCNAASASPGLTSLPNLAALAIIEASPRP